MADERDQERLADIVRKCGASRNDRIRKAGARKLWFQRGTDMSGEPAVYNKLKSHIRLLSSYLYAPDSVRFSLKLPVVDRARFAKESEVARDEFLDIWRDSGADVLFAQQVDAALVYASTIAKILPDPNVGVRQTNVESVDFGVLREDEPSLDRQEAFCHWFAMSLGEVEEWTRGHPQQASIMKWAREHASPATHEQRYPNMMSQVIVSNISGTFPAQRATGITNFGTIGDERPRTEEPLVEVCEVWEGVHYEMKVETATGQKHVRYRDFAVSTLIGDWPILERRNPVLPYVVGGGDTECLFEAEVPFVPIRPIPLLDYFWGESELDPLLRLQMLREKTLDEVDSLLARMADPAGLVSGVVGATDEKIKALRSPGGWMQTSQPGGKIEPMLPPDVTDKLYTFMDRIDAMFADQAGIPEILAGAQGAQQRSGDQVSAMANIAVGRIRKQALYIEDDLEVLATRMFHVLQRNDAVKYQPEGGEPFLLADLPAATTIKVSAHSASPVYADQVQQKAAMLLKAGAIDLPTFVDLMDPPHRDVLREKAKDLQKAQAENAQKRMQIEVMKAQRRRG